MVKDTHCATNDKVYKITNSNIMKISSTGRFLLEYSRYKNKQLTEYVQSVNVFIYEFLNEQN